MIKEKSGITLISLMVTVIVIAIITATGIYLGRDVIREARLQEVKTNMMFIQAKAQTIYEKLSFEKSGADLYNNLKGTKVLPSTSDEIILTRAGVLSEDIEKYYLWDENVLKEEGLEGIKPREGEKFYINYEGDVEVISSLGFKSTEGNTYYKLSEIKNIEDGE